jgi:hypothetical protein
LLFAHQQIPLGVPEAQYKLSWSVLKLRQLSLHGTNITPIQNNKVQPASSFASAQFNYTLLVIRRTDKNKQLTIVKPMQTGINRNKLTFCIIKS